MTRTEFNTIFAATLDSTDGFTAAQLDAINAAVFAEVQDLDVDALHTKSTVDHAFETEFGRF